MKGKKKVPKGYKKPGYNIGGTTMAPVTGDHNYIPPAGEGMRRSKGLFDDIIGTAQNVGVGLLDAGLGTFGANNLVDNLYSENRSTLGTKKFGNQWSNLTEQVAPAAAGLVGTALGGPAGGAIASAGIGGLQMLGNKTDVDPVIGLQEGGEVKGKKKLFPTKEDAKTYVQNSEYIDQARQLLNDELAKRLNLKAGQTIPDDAVLTPQDVAGTLKGSGFEDYYNKVRWMDDYYRRYGSPANTVAGQNEAAGSVEDTAYGARHRAAKYAKLRQPTESDIIINKIISEKNKQQENAVPDFMGIPLKKDGGDISASKAKEILHDGTAHGSPITDKQRKFFGWVASGKKADGGKVYNQELAANDKKFQEWYSKNTLEGKNEIPYSDSLDYDYYSFFKNNGMGSAESHFPDTYKRPSHSTFSIESLYSTPENPGGKWKGDKFIPNKADGGDIEGPGTAKSDSIHANIKPGAFVVPAENAHIGEKLRMLYLGGDKKAKLNQGGGVGVRLSDGEHLFSPEEAEYLRNMVGINLDALAPKAKKQTNQFAEGGGVGDKTIKEAEDLIKALAEEKAKVEKMSKKIEDRDDKEGKDSAVNQKKKQEEQTLLQMENNIKNIVTRIKSQQRGYKGGALEKSDKENLAKLVDSYKKSRSDFDGRYSGKSVTGKVNPDSGKDWTTSDAPSSVSGYDKRKAATPVGTTVEQSAQAIKPNKVAAASVAKPAKRPALVDEVVKKATTSVASEPEYDFMAENDRVMNVNPNQIPRESAPASTENTPTAIDIAVTDSVKANPFGNIDTGDILGLTQVGIGVGSLLSDGERPVDKLSPEYLDVVNRATQDAVYGFDPANRAAYERNIESARLGGVNLASQLAGGDAGRALANARAFTNQYSGNMLDFLAADNELKMQKRKYADTLVRDKVEQQRRLFEDKLNAFNVNQEAGASTLSAGITSLQNAQRNKDIDKLLAGLNTQPDTSFISSLTNTIQ